MSGLLRVLQLRRAGWDVDVCGRVESELSGRGASIVAQCELIDRLKGLGIATEALGVISIRMTRERAVMAASSFEVRPISGSVGADIHGGDTLFASERPVAAHPGQWLSRRQAREASGDARRRHAAVMRPAQRFDFPLRRFTFAIFSSTAHTAAVSWAPRPAFSALA
jgi:hypothetical protein